MNCGAITATTAAKDKQNEAYLDWYIYCQNNYAFLSSTAKAEFDKARKVVGNVTPGTTLSQKQKDAILAAYVAIVEAQEKAEAAREIANQIREIDDFWNRSDGFFDGAWWLDLKKFSLAVEMLRREAQLKGPLFIPDDCIAGQPTAKLAAIQELMQRNQ